MKISRTYKLYAYLFFTDFALMTGSLFLPWLITSYDNGATLLSLTTSFTNFSLVLCMPIIGYVIDRYSRKRVLLVKNLLMITLSLLAYHMYHSPIAVYIFMFYYLALQYGFRIFDIGTKAFIQQETPKQHVKKQIEHTTILTQVSSVLAPLIFYKIASFNNMYIFAFIAVLYFLADGALAPYTEQHRPRQVPRQALKNITHTFAHHWRLIIMLSSASIPYLTMMSYYLILPFYFQNALRLSLSDLAILEAVYAVASITGTIIAKTTIKAVSLKNVKILLAVYVGMAVITAFVSLMDTYILILGAFAGLGLCGIMSAIGITVYNAHTINNSTYGQIISITTSVNNIIRMISGLIIAAIFALHLSTYTFFYVAGLAILLYVLFTILAKGFNDTPV